MKFFTINKDDLKHYRYEKRLFDYLYKVNPVFRERINNLDYIYLDGFLVLNSKEFLYKDNNKITINSYAYKHPKKSFVPNDVFSSVSRTGPRVLYHSSGRPPRRRTPYRKPPFKGPKRVYTTFSKTPIDKLTIDELSSFGGVDGDTFGKRLSYYMEGRFTNESLAMELNVDAKTVSRWKNDLNVPDKKIVVALCIVLSLLPWDSFAFIDLAGYSLSNESTYMRLLFLYSDSTLEEFNDFLLRNELITLTKNKEE